MMPTSSSESIDDSVVTGVAYGLRIAGFRDPALQGRGSAGMPLVAVSHRQGEFSPFPHRVGPDRAEVGDTIVIDRLGGTAVQHGPDPLPTNLLVHPTLAWVGAVHAHWNRHLAIHGGAFIGDTGAWMVLAGKGGGKSSTLAALAVAGLDVLTDDLVVLDDGRVLSGPRCVDLKEEPGALLGGDVPYERYGERRRILLGEPPPPTTLAGAIVLEWGDRLAVKPVPVRDRLDCLMPYRTLQETDPRLMLGLAAVPTLVMTRPRTVRTVPEVVALLAELTSE